MKKAILTAILGITFSVSTSHGQGYIIMESYKTVSGTPVFSGVTYGGGNTNYVGAASGFKADLLYSLDGGATYTLAAGSQTSFWPGSHDGGTPTTDGAGVFVGPTVTIPGYTSGPVSFIVEAYNGPSFAGSISGGKFAGQSAPFTITSLQTDNKLIPGDLLQVVGTTPTGLQPFVLVIPEPGAFALAGLSAAGLMFFRRKK